MNQVSMRVFAVVGLMLVLNAGKFVYHFAADLMAPKREASGQNAQPVPYALISIMECVNRETKSLGKSCLQAGNKNSIPRKDFIASLRVLQAAFMHSSEKIQEYVTVNGAGVDNDVFFTVNKLIRSEREVASAVQKIVEQYSQSKAPDSDETKKLSAGLQEAMKDWQDKRTAFEGACERALRK